MKLPRQLTKRLLVKIVEQVRDWLYMDQYGIDTIKNEYGDEFATKVAKQADAYDIKSGLFDYINPDKTWDPDTESGIAEVLETADLAPPCAMTVKEIYRKPTPNENWKDDSIQFPRLLVELQGVGVINMLREGEWMVIEESMGQSREKIMQIFDRAQKEWDSIKKETK